ncbi:uncharacterized protein [Lolium perenne]|uniref:uncharacterized protein isoform X2 n=1 Tax=Lolium perenne TaxID=4522 RepID=UPI003A99A5D5
MPHGKLLLLILMMQRMHQVRQGEEISLIMSAAESKTMGISLVRHEHMAHPVPSTGQLLSCRFLCRLASMPGKMISMHNAYLVKYSGLARQLWKWRQAGFFCDCLWTAGWVDISWRSCQITAQGFEFRHRRLALAESMARGPLWQTCISSDSRTSQMLFYLLRNLSLLQILALSSPFSRHSSRPMLLYSIHKLLSQSFDLSNLD